MTQDKLLDGDNVTTSDFHMWLTTFTPGALHTITISLPDALPLLVTPCPCMCDILLTQLDLI